MCVFVIVCVAVRLCVCLCVCCECVCLCMCRFVCARNCVCWRVSVREKERLCEHACI